MAQSKKQNSFKLGEYFREVSRELKKVTWPSREKTIQQTMLVIAVSVVIALFLGITDTGLNQILEFILAQS